MLIYVDQSSRRIVLPVNGWAARITDLPMQTDPTRDLKLEGSRSIFIDDKTMFLILKDGTLYPVEIAADGKTVTKLVMGAPLAQTAIPAILKKVEDDHLFVGSTVGPSVLLKAGYVEEEVEEDEAGTAKVVSNDDMDIYDDDDGECVVPLFLATLTSLADLYGDSKPTAASTAITTVAKKTRSVLHLSLRDSLPAYGPITGMTFSLSNEGVSSDRSLLRYPH